MNMTVSQLASRTGISPDTVRFYCPCGHTLELLKVRIADIDAEIERLTELRSNLTGMLDSPPTPDCEAKWEWVCGPYMTTRGGERP